MITNSRHIQNRHILSMMGVAWWVNKDQQTHALSPMADRLVNPRLSHLLPTTNNKEVSDKPVYNTQPAVVDAQNQSSVVKTLAKTRPTTPSFTKEQDVPKTSDIDKEKSVSNADKKLEYEMQGVRFGCWLLVADMTMMDSEARFLWASLLQALTTHAQKTNLLYHSHQIHYPLLQDDNTHHSLMLANQTFLGFVYRLLFVGELEIEKVKVVFLTALPEGVNYPKHIHHLPSIDDMLNNPQLKKQLWATLVKS